MPCADGSGNNSIAMLSIGLKYCCWKTEIDDIWAKIMPLGVYVLSH